MTEQPTPTEIADEILRLCQQRGAEKTICPSEVARALVTAGLDWRSLMGEVRQVAGRLAKEGRIDVCQKGQKIDIKQAKGPIRLRWRPSPS